MKGSGNETTKQGNGLGGLMNRKELEESIKRKEALEKRKNQRSLIGRLAGRNSARSLSSSFSVCSHVVLLLFIHLSAPLQRHLRQRSAPPTVTRFSFCLVFSFVRSSFSFVSLSLPWSSVFVQNHRLHQRSSRTRSESSRPSFGFFSQRLLFVNFFSTTFLFFIILIIIFFFCQKIFYVFFSVSSQLFSCA
jgi:hypothetical protein